jgi:hypothetical protein
MFRREPMSPTLNRVARLLTTAGAAWIVSSLVGCGSSPASRFYVLTPLPTTEVTSPISGRKVAILPVEVAAHLDRPQIVTTIGPNELKLSEFDRWAEPPRDGVPRILTTNLVNLLGSEFIYQFDLPDADRDLRVALRILRFEGELGRSVTLEARWGVLGGKDRTAKVVKTSVIQKAVKGDGYAGFVGALSEAMGDLSREIADGIRAASKVP